MKKVDFSQIKITGGFWRQKQDMVRNVTVNAVYDRFKETGRFDAFKCQKDTPLAPHIFWDSDVAKWIEGVAYLTREKREPQLEAIVDEVVDLIEKNRDTCGYFNSFYLSREQENRFKFRDCHELYCMGHLTEAAVAYYEATGKDKLLRLMCDYADYVERVFKIEGTAGFETPGHEEIELALVRLYECTGEKRYLELSKHFVDKKGCESKELTDWTALTYCQSHKPVREQDTAEGHAVRAVYLYCAMADLALKYNDQSLVVACKRIFESISQKRMYITGGIGSSHEGEAFTVDYDLPNLVAYTESCAALGLSLFAHRMLLLESNAKFAHVVERAMYNGFMSSTSLDGKSFFYTNPLEILPNAITRNTSVTKQTDWLPNPQRSEVFDCSCCPPNIVRYIPSIANMLYTHDDKTVYIHQFMESQAKFSVGEGEIEIEQKTSYPYDGKVEITVRGMDCRVAVRVPEWCDCYKGESNGYMYYPVCKNGTVITLDFKMKPRFVYANTEVLANAGKCAVTYGPLVYCMEGCDNEGHLRNIILDTEGSAEVGFNKELSVPTITLDAYTRKSNGELYSFNKGRLEKTKATLIPYFAFANRGVQEMQVWHLYK
ncbi:MAG: glycoside hydrolase family 127 protein [Clostridia bacterium]|nr:glycoside hydrolase family 127 protein [Clostridia bacterium]